jgi:multidrug efflux pump subunit AcrA (membrane-fusion protein)
VLGCGELRCRAWAVGGLGFGLNLEFFENRDRVRPVRRGAAGECGSGSFTSWFLLRVFRRGTFAGSRRVIDEGGNGDMPQGTAATGAEAMWRAIERLVEDVAVGVRGAEPPERFFPLVLDRAIRATGAESGVIWLPRADHRWYPEYQQGGRSAGGLSAVVLEEFQRQPAVQFYPGGVPELGPTGEWVSRGAPVVMAPLVLAGELLGVLALVHPAIDDPQVQRACGELLGEFAERVSQWQADRHLVQLRERERQWQSWDRFVRDLHASWRLPDVVARAAHEARPLLGCDRVSVALRRRTTFRLEAISGQEEVDRRSPVVRRLERLATIVGRYGQPVTWSGPTAELPPEISEPLDAYLDVAHPRWLQVIPLKSVGAGETALPTGAAGDGGGERSLGRAVLVLEKFSGEPPGDLAERLERLTAHVARAIEQSWEYSSLPLAGVLRSGRWLFGREGLLGGARLWLSLLLLAAVVAGLAVPIDFTVRARGILQPTLIREVFAPVDGEVEGIEVRSGEQVEAGQVLLVLRNPALDLEERRLVGERATVRERLAAVESARLLQSATGQRPTTPDAASSASLTGSEEELRETLKSVEEQLAVLGRQRASLSVSSPLAGELLTWNLDELLEARPVTRGQTLVTVGETQGDWEVRLDLPDQRLGHLLTAQGNEGAALSVEFRSALRPDERYRGAVSRVAQVTSRDEEGRPVVRVWVAFDRHTVPELRYGTTVTARVHCGRRPVFYVWLHELWEFVQLQLLF